MARGDRMPFSLETHRAVVLHNVATTPIDLFTHMVQKPVMQAIISYISFICCEN